MLDVALSQWGTTEWPGEQHNPEVLKYFRECGFDTVIDDDRTSWCSVFMCWCALKAGLPHTNSMVARSWMQWGKRVFEPKVGDIAVFRRGNQSWQGHVGLYVRSTGSQVYVLGGNQSNTVNIAPQKGIDLLCFQRWEV